VLIFNKIGFFKVKFCNGKQTFATVAKFYRCKNNAVNQTVTRACNSTFFTVANIIY